MTNEENSISIESNNKQELSNDLDLSTTASSLYIYPGISPRFIDGIRESLEQTHEALLDNFTFIYNNNFEPDNLQDESRHIRRSYASKHSYASPASILRKWQASETTKPILEEIYSTQNMGLLRAQTIYSIVAANSLHYHCELDSSNNDVIEGFPEYILFSEYAFKEDHNTSTTKNELALKLREINAIDLSKDLLDKRFEHFLAVAQFEASSLFLQDLVYLESIGSRRQAKVLSRKYKQELESNDYERKIDMHTDLYNAFLHQAEKERDPQVRKLLHTLATRAQCTSEQLQSLISDFGKVYSALNYEPPEDLQTKDTDQSILIKQLDGPKLISSDQPKDIDENISNEIFEHSNNLYNNIEEFSQEWRLSAKQRREANLSKIQRELVMGFKDYTNRELLPPIAKSDAQIIVDCLYKLNSLDPEEAKGILDSFTNKQRALEDDLQLIKLVAEESRINIALPDIFHLTEYLSMFQGEWQSFRQLILKTWPNFEGAIAAQKIEDILFDQVQEITDDPLTTEAIALQKEIAQQLDKIILPPGSKKEDLERELERIGTQKNTVSQIEWKRLRDLVDICSQFEGTLFRSKDRALGNSPPYFVAVIDFGGEIFAVAESPVFGNATYVVPEKQSAGTWLEVLELSKLEARDVGAHRVIHSKKGTHTDKIYDKILALSEN